MENEKKYLALVLAVCAAVAFAFQGTRGVFDTTEGRYAECAREMAETGNWMAPQLGYQPHWTKPPMFYWAAAASMKLLGQNEWALRAPNALMAIVLCAAVYGIASSMWDKKTGIVAAGIFGTSPFIVAGTNTIATDMMLAMWAGLCVFCYWRALKVTGRRQSLWIVLMWGGAGLGFLTKGPPMLLIVAAIVIFNIIAGYKSWQYAKLVSIEGFAIFTVTALGWYVASVLTNKGLLDYWLKDEVVNRVVSDKFGRHPQWWAVFTLYMPIVLFGAGVWIIAVPKIIAKYKTQFTKFAHMRRFVGQREPVMFLVIWLFVPLAVFCLSRSRMPLYLLPIFAPVAIVLARGMVLSDACFGFKKFLALFTLIAVISMAAKGAYSLLPSKDNTAPIARFCLANSDNCQYILLNSQKDYGMQFYFGGKLLRVSSEPDLPMHDGSFEDKLREIAAHPKYEHYLLIARGDGCKLITQKCGEMNVQYTVKDFDNYNVFEIDSKLGEQVNEYKLAHH